MTGIFVESATVEKREDVPDSVRLDDALPVKILVIKGFDLKNKFESGDQNFFSAHAHTPTLKQPHNHIADTKNTHKHTINESRITQPRTINTLYPTELEPMIFGLREKCDDSKDLNNTPINQPISKIA